MVRIRWLILFENVVDLSDWLPQIVIECIAHNRFLFVIMFGGTNYFPIWGVLKAFSFINSRKITVQDYAKTSRNKLTKFSMIWQYCIYSVLDLRKAFCETLDGTVSGQQTWPLYWQWRSVSLDSSNQTLYERYLPACSDKRKENMKTRVYKVN